MSEFGVSRKEASVPLIVFFTMVSITGLLVGPLSQRCGIRSTTIAGSLIGAVGFATCFFATDLRVVTVSFGIFGFGYSFSFTPTSVILNRYFLSNRALINGIVFSGPCVGAFLFPPLYEFLIATYGLRGGLLILSGVVLQICIFGFLLRPPQLPQSISKEIKCSSDVIESMDEFYTTDPLLKERKENNETIQMRKNKLDVYLAIKNADKAKGRNFSQEVKTAGDFGQEDEILKMKNMKNGSKNMEDTQIPGVNRNNEQEGVINEISSYKLCPDGLELKNMHFSENMEDSSNGCKRYEISPGLSTRHPSTCKCRKQVCALQLGRSCSIPEAFKRVLSSRPFYFYSLTITIFYFTYQMFFVTIVDYCMDKGVVEADTKYMFFTFAIFDILGRLAIGWITDQNYLKSSQFLILTMAIIAFLSICFPFAGTFSTLNLTVSAYGLLYGSTFIISRVILLDILPSEVQEVAFGCASFFCGMTTFTYAFLIEYFRDNLGSYSNIFLVLAFMSLIASLLWILECYLSKSQKSK